LRNPSARAEAVTGKNLVIGGLVVGVAGLTTGIAGVAYAGSDDSRQDYAWAAIGVEAATLLIALTLIDNGRVHSYNAINIYNDGLTPDAVHGYSKEDASEHAEPLRASAIRPAFRIDHEYVIGRADRECDGPICRWLTAMARLGGAYP
jgi:hypothetical protein